MSLTVNFWLYNSKKNKNGEAPLVMRITLNNKRYDKRTGYFINPDNWDQKKQALKTKSLRDKMTNNAIQTMSYNVLKVRQELVIESGTENIELKELIKKLNPESSLKTTLIAVFMRHNEMLYKRIGKDFTKTTYSRYQTTLKKLKAFIPDTFRKKDIELAEINHKFLTDWEHHLKTNEGLSHNSAMKQLKNLKKIIRICSAEKLMSHNPYANFKITIKETKKRYLEISELQQLQATKTEDTRLGNVKNIFLFACYTGLSFTDLKTLSPANVIVGIDGKKWIAMERAKNNNQFRLPLLKPALEILDYYKNDLILIKKNRLLPVMSNQKYNKALKTLGLNSGLNKPLTSHMARHTFATTVTLSNKVPIETVSKMLGHKNLKTTQIYAKVIDFKISEDMNNLEKIFI